MLLQLTPRNGLAIIGEHYHIRTTIWTFHVNFAHFPLAKRWLFRFLDYSLRAALLITSLTLVVLFGMLALKEILPFTLILLDLLVGVNFLCPGLHLPFDFVLFSLHPEPQDPLIFCFDALLFLCDLDLGSVDQPI